MQPTEFWPFIGDHLKIAIVLEDDSNYIIVDKTVLL